MRCVIGGTNSWLDINDGKKSKKKDAPPNIPVYAPRGDSIENAALQFLLDCEEDVITMLNDRNKF